MNKMPGCIQRGTVIQPASTQLPLYINQLTVVNDFLQDTKQPLLLFLAPAFNLKNSSDWLNA